MPVDPTAALVLAQQRQYNPAENSRRQLALILQQNAQSFAQNPVKSPMEGIARALMTGVQGLTSGVERGYDEAKQRETSQGLLDYAGAAPGSPEQAAAQERLKNADPNLVAGIAAQQLALNQAQRLADSGAATFGTAYGAAPPPGGAAAPSGLGAPITLESLGVVPKAAAPAAPTSSAAAPQTGGYDPAKAVSFLTNDPDLKLAPHQAAGLVANLQRESGMVPTALNRGDGSDGSDSIGMGQWNAGRAAALNKFATDNKLDPHDPQTQMAFIKSELLGPESATLTALRNAPDAATAAAAGVGYFRPKDTAAAIAESQRRVLTMPGGIQVAQAPVITPAQAPGAPPLATMPSGTKIDPSIPAPPFMQTGTPGTPAAPPAAAVNVPAATPPAAAPPAAAPPPVGAVPSAPPVVPLPRATPEQIQKYQTLMRSGDPNNRMTQAQAVQALDKELRDQQQQQQTIATKAWEQQKAEETAKTASTRKAGELFTANTLNDYKTTIRPQAEQAVAGIQNIYQIKNLLDQGAFTGAGANSGVALAHVKQLLGMDPNAKISNTQVLQSQLASGVLQGIGKLSAGATKADNEFIQNAPNITWDEQALRKLVDISQREMQRRIDVHDKAAANILKFEGMNQPGIAENFQLEKPPSYEEWQKQNAPQAAAQQPGTAPAAPAAPIRLGPDGSGYDQVKPGDPYVDPHGNVRTKGGK